MKKKSVKLQSLKGPVSLVKTRFQEPKISKQPGSYLSGIIIYHIGSLVLKVTVY